MITIEQDVSGYRPAYNDDFFIVSSNNSTEDNFQFVCDVYVNGGANYVARLKTFPHPTNGNGLFNPKRIVENYLTKDFDLATNTFATNDNSYSTYILKFGEEFGLSSSGTPIYPNQTLTGTKYVWNAIFDFEDYIDYATGDHILNGATKQFLTNCPDNHKLRVTDRQYLYGITDTSGDIYYANVSTYNSAGTFIATYYIANPYQNVSTDAKKFFRVGVGGANLNTLTSGDVYTINGAFPMIGTNVSSYTVKTSTDLIPSADVTSETKTYIIDDFCTKTEANRVFFLNKLGGYDGITFKGKIKEQSEIKRSNYKRQQGSWNGASAFAYSKSDRANVQYDTVVTDTTTFVSDWLTEAEAIWIKELFTSPDVYIDKDGVEVPINITASSYETKQTSIAKLINVTIEFTYSYSNYRQRG